MRGFVYNACDSVPMVLMILIFVVFLSVYSFIWVIIVEVGGCKWMNQYQLFQLAIYIELFSSSFILPSAFVFGTNTRGSPSFENIQTLMTTWLPLLFYHMNYSNITSDRCQRSYSVNGGEMKGQNTCYSRQLCTNKYSVQFFFELFTTWIIRF